MQVLYAASPAYIAWGCSADIVMLLIMCLSWILEELKLFSVVFFLNPFCIIYL